MEKKITIGSRGSRLALWQAHYVTDLLENLGYDIVLKIIKTKGDKIQNVTFDKLEGKGFFTKEIEEALLDESVDLAVHSYKDLPTANAEGLVLEGNSYRENPADWLIIHNDSVDSTQTFSLKQNAVVGTSSPRRTAQLLHFRPDLRIVPIRGNVPTRVKKTGNEVEAVVLAAAGLQRLELDLSEYHLEKLPVQHIVPAPAQGVLGYQIRANDERMKTVVAQLNNEEVADTLAVEREILKRLEGGCQQPIGVYCEKNEGLYQLWACHGTIPDTDEPTEEKLKKVKLKKVFIEKTDKNAIIEDAVNALKDKQPKRIFVSRDLKPNSYFKQTLTQQGHDVFGMSLIEFAPIEVEPESIPQTDWVFFSSKNCVKYFVNQSKKMANHLKLAAISSGTAATLKEAGYKADFVGKSRELAEIAHNFELQAKGQSVLFPQAENSLQSIQKHLNGGTQIHNLKVYKNEAKQAFEIPESDLLVFTSPMNVRAYFSKYALQYNQTVVAIGKSTAFALEQAGIKEYRVSYNFDEKHLLAVCY